MRRKRILSPTWVGAGGSQLYLGDASRVLRRMPAQSVHVIVTSPPYWQRRVYAGEQDGDVSLGSEDTLKEYIVNLVSVFDKARRVLRDDGMLWVNLGDGFSGKQDTLLDRVGLPERFAIAMQEDGWVWRDDIIWKKATSLPLGVKGTRWVRCRVRVGASKQIKGKWNNAAYKGIQGGTLNDPKSAARFVDCPGCEKCRANGGYVLRKGSWRTTFNFEHLFMFVKGPGYYADQYAVLERGTTGVHRNPRSVQTFDHFSISADHLAAFPPDLPAWCIKVSTSSRGCCPVCGVQWARVLDVVGTDVPFHVETDLKETVDWRPSCDCGVGKKPLPSVVCDPFLGSGTTCQAANYLQRTGIGIEISEKYLEIAKRRVDLPLFAAVGARHQSGIRLRGLL